MDKFIAGFVRVLVEAIGGIITPTLLNAFTDQAPLWVTLLFGLVLLVGGNIALAAAMPSWGILFTLGWILGAWLLVTSGVIGVGGVLMWVVLPTIVLAARGVAWANRLSGTLS